MDVGVYPVLLIVNVVLLDSDSCCSSAFSKEISVRVPVAIEVARANLLVQFSDYVIVPSATFRVERRYWGELNGDDVILHGPKAYRQIQFLTVGNLTQYAEGTVLDAKIQVAKKDLSSLLLLLGVMVSGIAFIRWPLLALALPFYGVLFFSVIAWSFNKHMPDITNLLEQLGNFPVPIARLF